MLIHRFLAGCSMKNFLKPTKRFFSEIDAGRFTIVTSAIVEAEIEPAPKKIRDFFAHYEAFAEITQITQEMLLLQQQYINSGVVTPKSAEDALHVAINCHGNAVQPYCELEFQAYCAFR